MPSMCCRLNVIEHVGQLLDAAPKKELENILQLVCNIFGVSNALIALFGDRRIYINNTIGGFKVCCLAEVTGTSSATADAVSTMSPAANVTICFRRCLKHPASVEGAVVLLPWAVCFSAAAVGHLQLQLALFLLQALAHPT
eukprot:GHRR01029931.1.p1 GENE.GHRR01029931.1~~GHRR01029931.1.p1  ORF type:complete len:141 (-),score=45.24 GHRR01029931.1:390-812(-)